jgi:hypothetical protein
MRGATEGDMADELPELPEIAELAGAAPWTGPEDGELPAGLEAPADPLAGVAELAAVWVAGDD